MFLIGRNGPWPERVHRAVVLAVALLLVAACAPLRTLNNISNGDHYAVERDVPYGEGPRRRLDVYRPVDAAGRTPLVVFFYGGGWREGRKEDYGFVASALTRSGYTVVIPDYRLYPEVRFPSFVEDGAAAVARALGTAGGPGADAARQPLFLMGHSAGAHIAALLALDPAYLKTAGVDAGGVAGFIGLSGPYDFLPIGSGYLQQVFPEADREASQPIRFVSPGAPPTLLVHGMEDTTVEPGNSRRLAQALEQAGVDMTFVEQADRAHASVVAALAPPLQFVADTRAVTVRFIERVVQNGNTTAAAGDSADD